MQLDLLTDIPRARATDPVSSHLAAEEVRDSGRLGQQQAAVLAAVKRHPGLTSRELAVMMATDRYIVARRLPELEPVHVRKGDARKCRVGDRPAVTWWPA